MWRIKEEHYLWKRYLNDGLVLLRLLLTRVLPLAVITRWCQFRWRHQQDLSIKMSHDDRSTLVRLDGIASERHVPKAIAFFQETLTGNRNIAIDLSDTRLIDARFLGLLLMLRKELRNRGTKLILTGVSGSVGRNIPAQRTGIPDLPRPA